MAQGIFINCTINELVQNLHVGEGGSVMTEQNEPTTSQSWATPALSKGETVVYRPFDLLVREGHCQTELNSVTERLRIRCAAESAYALMRLLRELEQSHYVLLSDARGPKEVFNSLCASFPMPTITLEAFRDAWKNVK